MGKNNSSLCRVKPLMDYLLEDYRRLVNFLLLLGINTTESDFEDNKIFYEGHNGEKSLIPDW